MINWYRTVLYDHTTLFLCCFAVVLFDDPGKIKVGRTWCDEIALFKLIVT